MGFWRDIAGVGGGVGGAEVPVGYQGVASPKVVGGQEMISDEEAGWVKAVKTFDFQWIERLGISEIRSAFDGSGATAFPGDGKSPRFSPFGIAGPG